MYRSRLKIFAAITTVILLSIPAANLASRAYIGKSLWPGEIRDLWSVDRVEGSLAYLLMSCCDRSLHPNSVRIGRDDYLFLGNKSGKVIDKATGLWRPAPGLIEERVGEFSRLEKEVMDAGGSFAIVIAPNKHSIYPEMLPPDLTPALQTVTDEAVGLANAAGLSILDLRADMRHLKTSAQVYMKTDTHWTHAGAAASYDRIMEFLRGQRRLNVTTVDYDLTPIRRPAGDLAGLLKMQEMFSPVHDFDHRINLTPRAETCLATISMITGEASECESLGDGEVSVADKFMNMTRTANAPNNQTVLMLCDSFCASSSALFSASFSTVYSVHWKFLDHKRLSQLIETLQPDIVLLQMVERDMLTFGDD